MWSWRPLLAGCALLAVGACAGASAEPPGAAQPQAAEASPKKVFTPAPVPRIQRVSGGRFLAAPIGNPGDRATCGVTRTYCPR